MAKATEYTIGVKLTGDAVDLKEAVDEAAAAMSGLSDAADSEAAAASAALEKVAPAADDMAEGVADAASDAAKAMEEIPDAAADAADAAADELDKIPPAADSAADGVATATSAMTASFDTVPTAAESMAADVDASTVAMVESFETVPVAAAAMSTNLDATTTSIVNTSGKKLKGAGKLLGAQFVSGITGELASGNSRSALVGTANTLFSSLLVVGGVAALAAGIGGTLITGIIKSIDEKKKALAAAFDSSFSALEITAESTGRQIAESIMAGFEFETVVKSLAEEGESAADAWAKIEELAAASGASTSAIVELLQQGVNPETQLTADLVGRVATNYKEVTTATGKQIQGITDLNRLGQDVLDKAEANEATQKSLLELGKGNRDFLQSQADAMGRISAAASDAAVRTAEYANNMERADAAAHQLMGRRLPSDAVLAGN